MLIRYVLGAIAPPLCFACQAPGSVFCLDCLRRELDPYSEQCFLCLWGTPDGRCCVDCSRRSPIMGVSVVGHYRDYLPKLIYDLKHRPDQRLGEALGSLIARKFMLTGRRASIVAPVPTSPARYRERGYNQTELLARAVASSLRLPYCSPLVRRSGRHQIGLGRNERLEKIGGTFQVIPRNRLAGEAVLLIDDVMTTGATLTEAASVLKAAGAKSVWAGVVARA